MSNQPDIHQTAIDKTVAALRDRVDDPAQPAEFHELWKKLRSIRDFRRLSREDQYLLAGLMERVHNEKELSTIDSYVRQLLKAVAILSGKGRRPQLRKLFEESAEYDRRGVWTTTDPKYNARLCGVKAALDAAIVVDIASHNHLADRKTKARQHNPRPASDEALKTAVANALAFFRSRKGVWAIIAFRDLVMLDWKSYGPRADELAGLKRRDFVANSTLPTIQNSKSRTGERSLAIDDDTVALTSTYLAVLDAYRENKGLRPLGMDDPLFLGLRGRRLQSKTVSTALSRLLPAGVRPHDLRSRIATALARNHHHVDVGAVLGIRPDSTAAYVLAARTEDSRPILSGLHAGITLDPTDVERLGLPIFEPVSAEAPQRKPTPGSECWLPEEYLEELAAEEAA